MTMIVEAVGAIILSLVLGGCVTIDKRVYVHSKGAATVNMTSGTSLEDVIDATVPLRK